MDAFAAMGRHSIYTQTDNETQTWNSDNMKCHGGQGSATEAREVAQGMAQRPGAHGTAVKGPYSDVGLCRNQATTQIAYE